MRAAIDLELRKRGHQIVELLGRVAGRMAVGVTTLLNLGSIQGTVLTRWIPVVHGLDLGRSFLYGDLHSPVAWEIPIRYRRAKFLEQSIDGRSRGGHAAR